MPRFLHTADWQIGRTYRFFDPDDAAALAEARIDSVKRLASLANEHKCDAVLVAGDVFDMQSVSERLIRQTFNAMAAFTGPWVLLPGNHDAALAESVWTRIERLSILPANVHLALTPEPLLLTEQGLAILPAPLTQRHAFDDLTAWFDKAETPAGLLRIGLAHGAVQGVLAESIDSANPISPDRPERAQLDYLALGDWHGTKQISPRIWYSGTSEPERFVNNNPGNALLVDIPAPAAAPQVTILETAQHHWHVLNTTLTVESDLQVLQQTLQQLPAQSVVQIELNGSISLNGEEQLEAILQEGMARHRALVCNRSELQLQPTDDDIAALHADGYLAEVVLQLRDENTNIDTNTANDALRILAELLRNRAYTEEH